MTDDEAENADNVEDNYGQRKLNFSINAVPEVEMF